MHLIQRVGQTHCQSISTKKLQLSKYINKNITIVKVYQQNDYNCQSISTKRLQLSKYINKNITIVKVYQQKYYNCQSISTKRLQLNSKVTMVTIVIISGKPSTFYMIVSDSGVLYYYHKEWICIEINILIKVIIAFNVH